MKWIVPVENMREADRYCIEKLQVPGIILMEAAARSVVEKITMQCRKEDKILVICGTGNNGGDGFAIARMLKIKGYAVRVFLAGSPWMLSGDAKINFDMLSSYQISVLTQDQALALEGIINQSDWVVDAMFGTGLDREVTGLYDQIIKYVNKVHDRGNLKVMAVDIPSGVAGNTGQILGCAIEADETVTFCRLKPGLVLFPGKDFAGKVTVADIGIPDTVPSLKDAYQFMLDQADIQQLIPQRVSRSHKGLYGQLLSVSGSRSMPGAALLSAKSAYKMGTGLVNVAIPKEAAMVVLTGLPEAVTTPYSEGEWEWIEQKVKMATAVLVGPGLSQEPYVEKLLYKLFVAVPKEVPLVLDADALNWIAKEKGLADLIRARKGNTILTPHLGEASRLLKWSIPEIMQHPVEAVKAIRDQYESVAVLKDAMTLVCAPDGKIFYNNTGNNGMSTAGSGDVLAGMIAGLCAQGCEAFKAAYAGVYLHGAAGDRAKEIYGTYGMTASNIAEQIHLDKIAEK